MPTDAQRERSSSNPNRRPVLSRNKPLLTPAQREAIRRRLADGEKAIALAAEYGVSRSTIDRYR